jgi:hypothetical protein
MIWKSNSLQRYFAKRGGEEANEVGGTTGWLLYTPNTWVEETQTFIKHAIIC